MLVQACPKEIYERSQVEDRSSSAAGNVEVSLATPQEPVPVEIAANNFEYRDPLVRAPRKWWHVVAVCNRPGVWVPACVHGVVLGRAKHDPAKQPQQIRL